MSRNTRSTPGLRVGVEILVLLSLAASVFVFGYWLYAEQRRAIEQDVHEHLREVTELKASEVASWRDERFGDAQVARTLVRLLPGLKRELQGQSDPETERELSGWLDSIRQNYRYANVSLADSTGKLRLISGQLLGSAEAYQNLASEVSRGDSITLREFPPSTSQDKAHFVLAAGLATANGQHIGALLFGIDPAVYLYPVVLRWPSPSRTGQVLLLRRDRSSALFLSNADGIPGAAMKVRREFTDRASVSARAVQGHAEVDGRIGSGVEVEGAARQVPGSDWFVLATLHADEAYQRLGQIRTGLWLVGTLLVLLSAAGIEVIRRRQLSKFYRQQYIAEIERKALLGHYDYLTRYANDAILLIDEDDRIVEANERCTDYSGYTRDELLGMRMSQLRVPERQARRHLLWEDLRKENSQLYEAELLRKDGSRLPVECSTRLIEVSKQAFAQAIVRDITERKLADQQIHRLNRLYHVFSYCGQAIIRAQSENDLFDRVCRIAVEQGGFKLACVGTVDDDGRIQQVSRAGE